MPEQRYPDITFVLPEHIAGDGFVLVQRARATLRRAGVSNAECERFIKEAIVGDLEHRINTIKKWMVTK